MTNQEKLNSMCPVFGGPAGISFGDRLYAMITLENEIKADFATLKTQFDGLVTDINSHFGNYDKLRKMLMNACLGNAALAMSAGTTDQPKSVNAVVFAIAGQVYAKGAADPLGAWTGGHTGLGNSKEAYYLMCLDVSGNLSTVEGAIVAAGAGCVLPAVPAGKCAIGALKVVTGAAGVFVPDTTALNDGGITVTYVNLAMVINGADLAAASSASSRVCPAISAAAVETLD